MILIMIFIVFILLFYFSKADEINKELSYRSNKHRRSDINKIRDREFTKEDKNVIFEKFNHKCFNCGSTKKLTIDHHFPLDKGFGLKNIDGTYNAVLLCSSCNMKKSNKNPDKFYTKEQLHMLEKNFGIINKEPQKADFYALMSEGTIVELDYLGKIYSGIISNILEEDKNGYGKRKKVYLELETKEGKLLFLKEGINRINSIEEDSNVNI